MQFFRRSKDKVSSWVEPEFKSLLDEAKGRLAYVAESEQEQREDEEDDLAFCDSANQWPGELKTQRQEEGRPCLVVDRTSPFVNQVVNEFRQNRPQPQVNPVGDGADKDTAEIFQGLIRHIAYQSNGDTAIDTAFESMVRCGRGYFRVVSEYSSPESFDQDVVIKRVPDPHLVFLDPSSTEPDGSDANFGFIAAWVSRDVYRKEYPESKLAQLGPGDWESLGDHEPKWAQKDGSAVLVVEYYRRVRKPVKIHALEDGTKIKGDLPEGVEPLNSRDSYEIEVEWYKLNALEVLEKTVWPDKYVPIVPMLGTELIVGGKRSWWGLVRTAKDPQRAYNYWKSAQAEAIALAPRAPWVGPKGFMGNLRGLWQASNRRPVAALEYEPYDSQQRPLPAPNRIMQEPAIGAITQAMVGAVDDLKATTGMYDPSLGNREASQSGVAIRQLQRQGQVGNFHFMDNASRSIRHLGRILLGVAPKFYDTKRTVRIIKPDESVDQVTINGPSGVVDKQTGLEKVYKLDVGTYDVTVSVGPSYQTKRQENLALLESLLQGPMGGLLTQAAPDLVASEMDFAIVPKLVERLKKALPPQFQDDDSKGQPQVPPQAKAQMDQMSKMVEQLTQTVHSLQDQIEKDQAKAQGEIEKAKIAAGTDIQVAAIRAEAEVIKGQLTAKVPGAAADAQEALQQLEDLQHVVLALHSQLASMAPPPAATPMPAMPAVSDGAAEPPGPITPPHADASGEPPSPGGMALPGQPEGPLA